MYATIASFLIAISGSLASRVLLSLGFGFFSYAAISTVVGLVVTAFTSNYNSVNSDILQLLNLSGFGVFFGIIISAITTRAALLSIKKLRPI